MAESDLSYFEQFIQQHNLYTQSIKDLKTLGLKFYFSENCGYCRNMKSILSPYHKYIEYKNVADSDVMDDIKAHHKKCTGFPYFTSTLYNSYHLGATPSVERLIQSLRTNENNLNVQEKTEIPSTTTKETEQQPIAIAV